MWCCPHKCATLLGTSKTGEMLRGHGGESGSLGRVSLKKNSLDWEIAIGILMSSDVGWPTIFKIKLYVSPRP
jgi:hypothetical protein